MASSDRDGVKDLGVKLWGGVNDGPKQFYRRIKLTTWFSSDFCFLLDSDQLFLIDLRERRCFKAV